MKQKFPNLEITYNGYVLRYLFLGLEKMHINITPKTLKQKRKETQIDNFIGRILGLKGGVITTMGTK